MEVTVAQKLEALLNLQKIDSELDEIKKLRGDLPEEVQDLEDEIAGYETRIKKFTSEIDEQKAEISALKNAIKEADKLVKRYEEQQMNVRNSREFDAISKEIESQKLDAQLFEKKIKEFQVKIEYKNQEIATIKSTLDERKKDLEVKKAELDTLVGESTVEEEKLQVQREAAANKIEERLLVSYNKLRKNSRNGLAVVLVKRDACGGCFNFVPPQRQAEIKEKKKIIVCEHCGRVLADVEMAEVEIPTGRGR
jgi:predicted  nucleic acid-binding Zn-ribbon protein